MGSSGDIDAEVKRMLAEFREDDRMTIRIHPAQMFCLLVAARVGMHNPELPSDFCIGLGKTFTRIQGALSPLVRSILTRLCDVIDKNADDEMPRQHE